jgi:hypothetical protein
MKTYEPILLAEARSCAYPECREKTLWMRPRQRSRGMCLDHMVRPRAVTRTGERHARDIVFAVFPATEVLRVGKEPRQPAQLDATERMTVRGTWIVLGAPWRFSVDVRARDTGPCRSCGALTRHAYGAAARVCAECEASS